MKTKKLAGTGSISFRVCCGFPNGNPHSFFLSQPILNTPCDLSIVFIKAMIFQLQRSAEFLLFFKALPDTCVPTQTCHFKPSTSSHCVLFPVSDSKGALNGLAKSCAFTRQEAAFGL